MTVLEIFPPTGAASRGSIATYLDQLGLSHFLTGNQFHSIALKQVMDAKDCALANYQSLVGTPSPIHRNQRSRETRRRACSR